MKITKAIPSEAHRLTEIAFAAKRHWGYPEAWIAHWRPVLTITPEFVATHETYAARMEAEGRIVGFSAFAHQGGVLRLEDLWVWPGEIGRGIGRALFHDAQQRARALGFETFEIESDPHAAGFYARMGAERIGTHTTLLEEQPRELPVFRCRTSLERGQVVETPLDL